MQKLFHELQAQARRALFECSWMLILTIVEIHDFRDGLMDGLLGVGGVSGSVLRGRQGLDARQM